MARVRCAELNVAAAPNVVAVLVVVATFLVAACGEGRGGGALVVHSSLPDEVTDYAEDAFEAAHPDVDVRFVEASPAGTLEQLRARGSEQIDVWWGAPGPTLALAAEDGLLSPYRPAWAEAGTVHGDVESRWHVSLVSPFVIAFNRERLTLSLAPRDWIDLFHFRFRDEIVLLDPAASPEMAHFVGAMLVKSLREHGDLQRAFDWHLRLDASVATYVRDPTDLLRRLGAGDALLTILPRHVVEAARHDDAPWIHYRMPESGTPVLSRGIAIPVSASEPELARAFVDVTGAAEVITAAKLHTRWAPSQSGVDRSRIPDDFELDASWTRDALAADTLAVELEGWLRRWEEEVRGQGKRLF